MPSVQTGGLAYLQGVTGLLIRVNFPSLQDIMLLTRDEIAEARLNLSPVETGSEDYRFPEELDLILTDEKNNTGAIFASLNADGSSRFLLDELYNEETYYSFDVTQYIEAELEDAYIDPEDGILIVPAYPETRFTQLILDATNRNTKLMIYYLSY